MAPGHSQQVPNDLPDASAATFDYAPWCARGNLGLGLVWDTVLRMGVEAGYAPIGLRGASEDGEVRVDGLWGRFGVGVVW